MEELKPEPRLVIDPKQVMSHFCWSYCNALLQEAIALDSEDKIFEGGSKDAWERQEDMYASSLNDIAYSVLMAIALQINGPSVEGSMVPERVGRVISSCQEFLDIFKEKMEGTSPTPISRQSLKETVQLAETVNSETVERCIQRVSDVIGLLTVGRSSYIAAKEVVDMLQKQFGFVPKEVSNV